MAGPSWIFVILFSALLASRLYLQPVFSLISDCDETFNYWEPLNFLLRGFGKQTWEYSPEYSIRSWAFLLPLFTLLSPINKIVQVFELPPSYVFYAARFFLGLLSLVMEWSLYNEISSTISAHGANLWLFFQIFNAGWFHASVELLPSSFAMITILGSTKYTLRYLSTGSQDAFVRCLLFVFVGGILGWPFVLVLGVPVVIHYVYSHRIMSTMKAGFRALMALALVLGSVFAVDYIFYGRFTPVAWNIVMYNVIGADEKSGPNIFGVEPWYYYILNLLLNFPLPVLLGSFLGIANLRLWPIWGGLVTWMAIFFQQPHKEERFLYPVYALVTLAASVGFANIWKRLERLKAGRSLLLLGVCTLTLSQASLRIFALVQNYHCLLYTSRCV